MGFMKAFGPGLLTGVLMAGAGGFFYWQNHIKPKQPNPEPAEGESLASKDASKARPKVKPPKVDMSAFGELPSDCTCAIKGETVKLYMQVSGRMNTINDQGQTVFINHKVGMSKGEEEPLVLFTSETTAPAGQTEGLAAVWSVACDDEAFYIATSTNATRWEFGKKGVSPSWNVALPERRGDVVKDGDSINIECLPGKIEGDSFVVPGKGKPDLKLSLKDGKSAS